MKVLFKGKKHPTINETKLTPRKKLGFFLFFDKTLSSPPGQSCGTCHDPQHGFEDGVFKTLKEVVRFYNTRDTGKWPLPEVPETVNRKELGHLGLSDEEVDAIVVFLNTLTDKPIKENLD